MGTITYISGDYSTGGEGDVIRQIDDATGAETITPVFLRSLISNPGAQQDERRIPNLAEGHSAFSADGNQVLFLWEVPFDQQATEYYLIGYQLDTGQFFVGPREVSTIIQSNSFLTPTFRSPRSFDFFLASYLDTTFLEEGWRNHRLDSALNVVWENASPVRITSGVRPVTTFSVDEAVFAFAISNGLDHSLFLWDAANGNQLAAVSYSNVRRSYAAVVPIGSGNDLKLLAIPNGTSFFGDPVVGANLIEVYDKDLTLVATHQLLNYDSKELQDARVTAHLSQDETKLLVTLFDDSVGSRSCVLVDAADPSVQTTVPGDFYDNGTLNTDATKALFYQPLSEGFVVYDLVGDSVETSVSATPAVRFPSPGWPAFAWSSVGGPSTPPVIPPFWTAFNKTSEVIE